LEHSKVKKLDFYDYPWQKLPSGVGDFTNLTSLDV